MIGNDGTIYAVGDVHGHADKLVAMHAAIRRDVQAADARPALLIHLGDYIDRGPDSSRCLSIVAAGGVVPGVPEVNLMGNHEAMLLDALDRKSSDAAELWIYNGGDVTLESWGIDPRAPVGRWSSRSLRRNSGSCVGSACRMPRTRSCSCMPGCGRECGWRDSGRTICCGSARAFSIGVDRCCPKRRT